MMPCAYCQVRAGAFTDHLITKNQARRSVNAAANRENPAFKVRSCRECNEAKGTRLRVPPSHSGFIDALESITGGVYEVWDGSPEGLREVVK